MIEPDVSVYPQNVVMAIADRVEGTDAIDPDTRVFRRPLRNTDPNQSFGVFGNLWEPNPDSYEMGGGRSPGPAEPTIQVYSVGIQAFVKDTDEQRGLAVHNAFAYRVRTMLYRDELLRVTLRSLGSTAGPADERMLRWNIANQRLISNEINESWLYLSTLELRVETQFH